MFWDPSCSSTRMYGLNTKFIHYRPHSDYNFITAGDRIPVNQDGLVVPMFWKGNMTVSNRARQAIIVA